MNNRIDRGVGEDETTFRPVRSLLIALLFGAVVCGRALLTSNNDSLDVRSAVTAGVVAGGIIFSLIWLITAFDRHFPRRTD